MLTKKYVEINLRIRNIWCQKGQLEAWAGKRSSACFSFHHSYVAPSINTWTVALPPPPKRSRQVFREKRFPLTDSKKWGESDTLDRKGEVKEMFYDHFFIFYLSRFAVFLQHVEARTSKLIVVVCGCPEKDFTRENSAFCQVVAQYSKGYSQIEVSRTTVDQTETIPLNNRRSHTFYVFYFLMHQSTLFKFLYL